MLAVLVTVASATAWPLAVPNNAVTLPVVISPEASIMTNCHDTTFCPSDMEPAMGTPFCCDKYPDLTADASTCWRGMSVTMLNKWLNKLSFEPWSCDIIVQDAPAWWCCDAKADAGADVGDVGEAGNDYDDDYFDDDFFFWAANP